MAATMDDTSNMAPADPLATEHVCVDDIGTQLINIESVQQTIREQVLALENNGIEISVNELKSLLPKLDSLQNSLRKTFDTHSRPLIQKLHIFNVPDELLVKTFEEVRGDSGGIKDIKSLRLTCIRFCNASSHLLLQQLDVSLTHSSLEHLDKVSRHPTISKGIRSLQICAAFYKTVPAINLQTFLHEVFGILNEDHMRDFGFMQAYMNNYRSSGSRWSCGDDVRLSKIGGDLAKRKRIMLSCHRHLDSRKRPRYEDQNIVTLRRVYERYSQLYEDQNLLMRGFHDVFAPEVAKVMARLPTAVGLTITDHTGPELRHLLTELSNPIYNTVRERLLESVSWALNSDLLFFRRPNKLLYELPLAIFRVGKPLTELRISLDPKAALWLELSEEQVRGLASAAEHLEVVDISCQMTTTATQSQQLSWDDVFELVSLFLKGTNLRSVSLRFGSWPEEGGLSIEPLLALLPWANLKEISLVTASVHYDELIKHLEKLAPGTYILFEQVHLLSGFWEDLLDVIRAKANCDSVVIDPTGDDCWGLRFQEIFDVCGVEESPAVAYIRGHFSNNPFQDDTWQVYTDSEECEDED